MSSSSTTSSGVQIPDKVNDGKSVVRRARVDSESEDIQGQNSLKSSTPQDTDHFQEAAPPFQVASIVRIPYILLMFLIGIIRMLAQGVSGSSHRNNPERPRMPNMAFGSDNKDVGNTTNCNNSTTTNTTDEKYYGENAKNNFSRATFK